MTMTAKHVFVATDERCGGTTLTRVLRLVTGGTFLDDPFNRLAHNDRYLSSTEAQIEDSITRLFAEYRGVKCSVCLHDVPEYSSLLRRVIQRECKFVFLWRRNILHRALSRALAIETGVWSWYDNSRSPDEPKRPYETKGLQIDMDQLETDVELHRTKMMAVRSLLDDLRVPYFDLEYSNLYGRSVNMDQRLAQIGQLCRFLEIDPIVVEAKRHELEFSGFLLRRAKLNSTERYRGIVNISEIESRFSNPGNGYLWDEE